MRAHTFLGFNHPRIQQLRQHNATIKQAWAVLVGDTQGITKTMGRDQQRGFPFALQQGIGRHGRAHLHAFH